ncbi:hypothetical protein [Pseudomonas synxantha]|nr:hypothetical protein [Pseudomonas synxantha]MDQ0978361.1 hypothetical protein [Pseudomonas synxantha]
MQGVFKQPMFVIGVSFISIGLAIANPGFWIPGIVFMVIGWANRSKQ